MNVEPEIAKNTLHLVDGRLVFSSRESLEQMINGLKDNDIKKAEMPENFLSLRAAIDNKTSNQNTIGLARSHEEPDLTDELEELVPDPYFASVLNANGEIQIGEVLYCIVRSIATHIPVRAG